MTTLSSTSLCCPSDAWEGAPQARMPWLRLVIGIFIAAQTMSLGMAISLTRPDNPTTLLLLQGGMLAATLLVVGMLGIPLAIDAVRELLRGRMTLELLFSIGVAAALAVSVHAMIRRQGLVYFDVVCVLVIVYSVGRAINAHSRTRALSASRALTRQITTARRVIAHRDELIPVESIAIGDRVRVLPGEWIPVDGTILEGASLVRQTPFSGEWTSTPRAPGDEVLAGTAAEDGSLLIQATTPGADRRVDRLAELIDAARRSPTSLQRQADRLVRWFLPLVLVICTLTLGYWALRSGWEVALFNTLSVLLIACPCAAGLATPLALWSTLGHLAQRGLIIRAGDTIERLAAIDTVVFDKTGTLGDEQLTLQSIATDEDPAQRTRTLSILRAVEQHSNHPVARVLSAVEVDGEPIGVIVRSLRVLPGQGVEADVQLHDPGAVPHRVRITRDPTAARHGTLRLNMTIDRAWAATITLVEHLRDSATPAIEALRELRLDVRIMTGDGLPGARRAEHLGAVTAAMTPEDKHRAIHDLRDAGQRPLFIGDGINDAAAMAASHTSIAIADGADIAIDTASATLHGGDLMLIPHAVALSRRAVTIIRSNLLWSIIYNFTGILIAAAGYLHPVAAGVFMGISSAIVGWRSFRVVPKTDEYEPDPTPQEAAWRAVHAAPRQPVVAPTVPALPEPSALHRRLFGAFHAVGWIGQGVILALLSAMGSLGWALTLASFGFLTCLTLRIARRLPPFADMILGMLSLGGLGMNLGWWADGGFASAIQNGAVHSCCSTMIEASVGHESHWMYWGMLLVGIPAMYLLRWRLEPFSLRRWCCIGPIVLGIPGMVFGMYAGAVLASHLGNLPPTLHVVTSYVMMMLGMAAGMLLPHLREALDPPTMNPAMTRPILSPKTAQLSQES